jgi:ABC-2 type transport system permease protein
VRKTWAVARREFGSFVGTKAYVLGTLFGPAALLLLIALPVLLEDGGGGAPPRVDVAPAGDQAAVAELRRRVEAGELDGYLVLPDDPEGAVVYEGRTADFQAMAQVRAAAEQAVQRGRLAAAGIDPDAVERALAPVPFESHATEPAEGVVEPSDRLTGLVLYLNTMMYLVILLYGISVLRSVQEEKERRVVEILLSSLRPAQLMTGKVLGIGAAGLLQVAIWIVFAIVAFTWGDEILTRFGMAPPSIPRVPAALAVVVLAFFAGGYFLYATLYAALGAIASSWQDAQNLQFPALIILMVAFFLTFEAMDHPQSRLSELTSLVPFTSPLVVPARTALGAMSWGDFVAPLALLVLGCVALLWLAGRVFRFTILATGARPTPRRLWRWLRAG